MRGVVRCQGDACQDEDDRYGCEMCVNECGWENKDIRDTEW